MTDAAAPQASGRATKLRANTLAAVVMLLVQFCLGISVSLYSALPPGGRHQSVLAGFRSAVGTGPVLLSLHALLGTLLLITASAALLRSIRRAATPLVALSGLGLLAIVAAWIAGAAFVGRGTDSASLTMAIATALAILCYTLTLFLLPRSQPSPPADATQPAAT